MSWTATVLLIPSFVITGVFVIPVWLWVLYTLLK
jgi:hypothetical protein